jgi:DNA-binding response OmpR family regulator
MPNPAPPTILVVDDEILIRMMVVDALTDEGFACVEAGSADQALAELERDPGIAMLISDIGLSGKQDGHWLVEQACTARPDLAVMLMSGYSDAAEVAGGATAVLSKPFDAPELIARVHAQLAGGRS